MGYSNFFFYFRQIYYILRRSKFFKIILITAIITFVFTRICFGVTASEDLYYEISQKQINFQNDFVYFCMFPYFENTESWQQIFKPLFDEIKTNQYDVYIGANKRTDYFRYSVTLYHFNDVTSTNAGTFYSKISGTQSVNFINYSNVKYYEIFYDSSTNTHSYTLTTRAMNFPEAMGNIKSDLFIDFCNMIYGSTSETAFFDSVLNSLDNIEDINTDILTELGTLSSSLNQISSNTSTNYSQQISAISGKIDDILQDNDDIISQNDEMIAQQEEINNNLEQVSSDIQDVNDTLTDDTVESTASDLPSTNVQDPSETGISNIFQSIYNAFCTGQAQDIVFPIPFTNKNITLSAYYVSDMLNNNGAGWVYTLIQAFWGYLIGRFIVSDISKKIDKVKSGNIENIENTNIKEEML